QLKKNDLLHINASGMTGEGLTVSTPFKPLITDVHIGDHLLLDDGLLEIKVVEKKADEIITKVLVGGTLTSNKGINLPNTKLNVPALTDKDKSDLDFAIHHDIDYVALSFVREPDDLHEIINIIESHDKFIPVISKIEKPEAVKNITKILELSWGIMVARGDLGVELPVEDVPLIQKSIVQKCNKLGKPVIIATQMLDSMIRNPRPTRAEASDVANAVLDGADAVMLSGETAAGKYPLESVQTMDKIIKRTENRFFANRELKKKRMKDYPIDTIAQGVSYSAVNIANNLKAKLIAVITHTGKTARQIARYKSFLPILAITDDPKVPSKMALAWGVTCILIKKIERTEESLQAIENLIENSQFLEEDDLVVITAGMPTLERNSTNMIKVHQIKKGHSKII
ncbi:MAG: pyruvate kinase, partial [Calditrichaeota bacterium]|nr:pyruvate kinase [Calditrichota bacterium]